jgi:hypothetical protein
MPPTNTLTGTQVNDYAPPITSVSISPTKNADNTYTAPISVTLTATASADFSIAHTYYKIDNNTQQTYTTPPTISTPGNHTITYWSVDSVGLTESQNIKTAVIGATTQIGNCGKTLAQKLNIQKTPLLMFRIGYAKRVPKASPRLQINKVTF